MDIGDALYYILSNNAAIAAVVGQVDNTEDPFRIYPLYMAQTVQMPAITYQAFEPTPNNTKSGPSELDVYRVQINSIAETVTDAKALSKLVRTALDYVSGTFAGVNVQFISYQGGTNNWEDGSKLEGAAMIAHDYLIREVR